MNGIKRAKRLPNREEERFMAAPVADLCEHNQNITDFPAVDYTQFFNRIINMQTSPIPTVIALLLENVAEGPQGFIAIF